MTNLYIGDLHLGNVYTSIIDFAFLISKVKNKKFNEVIFLGDFLDGIEKYNTHKYKQYNEVMTLQHELMKWLIEFVNRTVRYERLVFVLGNHDFDPRWGSLIDTELYTKVYHVEFHKIYIDYNSMLCVHQLAKSNRVGSQSGWTPSMVDKAKTMLMEYKERGVSGIITAHVHKIFDVVYNAGYKFILMPSFMVTGRGVAEDYMFTPLILAMSNSEMRTIERPFHDTRLIELFNMRFYNEILIDRGRVSSIEDIMRIYNEVLGEYEEIEKELETVNELEAGKDKFVLLYDKKYNEYIVKKNGNTMFRLPGKKLNEIMNLIVKKYDYMYIQSITGVNRIYISLLARLLGLR